LALSVLAVIWRNPEMMDELEGGNHDYTVDLSAPALPTPLSKVEPPYAYRDHSFNYRKRYRKQWREQFSQCIFIYVSSRREL